MLRIAIVPVGATASRRVHLCHVRLDVAEGGMCAKKPPGNGHTARSDKGTRDRNERRQGSKERRFGIHSQAKTRAPAGGRRRSERPENACHACCAIGTKRPNAVRGISQITDGECGRCVSNVVQTSRQPCQVLVFSIREAGRTQVPADSSRRMSGRFAKPCFHPRTTSIGDL